MTGRSLPESWAAIPLAAVGEWRGGGTPSKTNSAFWNGGIPWASPKDMKVGRLRNTADSITDAALDQSAATLIPANSVAIVTRSGILAHTFPVATTETALAINQDLKAIIPHKGIDHEYLAWVLRAEQHAILSRCSKDGTTVRSIEMPSLYAFEVPLAPYREQLRIVGKIEELFSELDNGVASLHATRQRLAAYREALLKAAFDGRLTADWRERYRNELETPDEVAARTKQESERRYQHALNEWEVQVAAWLEAGSRGRKPPKPRRAKVLGPMTDRERADLPEIPDVWAYGRLASFVEEIQAGKSFKCEEREPGEDEIGVAKVSAVSWGAYDERESKTCVDPSRVNPSLFIRPGDFLFSRANTIELVGACVIVRSTSKRVMLSDKTLRLVYHSGEKEFFLQYLRSQLGRKEIMRRSTGNQESMRNIGQDRIRSIIIPMCSRREMAHIAELLDEKLTLINALDAAIQDAVGRADALRHSILRKAFAGQLVEQDPCDEPASVLLERIARDNGRADQKDGTRRAERRRRTST